MKPLLTALQIKREFFAIVLQFDILCAFVDFFLTLEKSILPEPQSLYTPGLWVLSTTTLTGRFSLKAFCFLPFDIVVFKLDTNSLTPVMILLS